MPRLRVPSAERQTGLALLPLGRFATGDLTMEPVSDAFTDSHPQRGRRKRLAVITGSFQIFPDRRWASLRLGTNARLPPKWHVCLSVCSLRCARRLPRATSTRKTKQKQNKTFGFGTAGVQRSRFAYERRTPAGLNK